MTLALGGKKDLTERFIENLLPHIVDSDEIPKKFVNYWQKEEMETLKKVSNKEAPAPKS